MRKVLILPFIVVCSMALYAADVVIDSFTARSDNNDITLQWSTSKEENLRKFDIERRVSTDNEYKVIGSVYATGSQNSYSFIDENAFFKGEQNEIAGTTYFYRLKIVGSDNDISYSNTTQVTHTVSSVRRTWGMIKEMFR